jgi:hypothetical protein
MYDLLVFRIPSVFMVLQKRRYAALESRCKICFFAWHSSCHAAKAFSHFCTPINTLNCVPLCLFSMLRSFMQGIRPILRYFITCWCFLLWRGVVSPQRTPKQYIPAALHTLYIHNLKTRDAIARIIGRIFLFKIIDLRSRVIAQAIRHWLLTTRALIQSP